MNSTETKNELFKRIEHNASIGCWYFDNSTKRDERLINRTSNSFELTQAKKTESGINCSNWFEKSAFNKRFNRL